MSQENNAGIVNEFKFLDVGTLSDGEIEVVVKEKQPADDKKGYVPGYEFEIRLLGKPDPIGRVGLRIGNTKRVIMDIGHIGYEIKENYRGHRYAAKACNLVKSIAVAHGLQTLWILCDPGNIASRRTCEILGCDLVEIVNIPEGSEMYQRGERQACRYRWDLENYNEARRVWS